MKREVNLWDYAGKILETTGKGVLLTTKMDGKVNTMTIGWGHIGIEWGRPIFVAYVRESRYTKQYLEKTGEFTVNIPLGECDGKLLGFCGTKSGRDTDKIEAMGLTLEAGETVSVPGIRQLPLTLECKVIYKQDQPLSAIGEDIISRYYSQGDPHTAYYGQILNAYIIED